MWHLSDCFVVYMNFLGPLDFLNAMCLNSFAQNWRESENFNGRAAFPILLYYGKYTVV